MNRFLEITILDIYIYIYIAVHYQQKHVFQLNNFDLPLRPSAGFGAENWQETTNKHIQNEHATYIIELDDGKIYRKALYLMVKTMVSCRFSLKPIQ